jgi:hypothetical protein
MTEKEAKTKWCPHSQLDAKLGDYGGNFVKQVNNGNCIGSACMMWVWDREEVGDTGRMFKNSTEYGRCGLAGKP